MLEKQQAAEKKLLNGKKWQPLLGDLHRRINKPARDLQNLEAGKRNLVLIPSLIGFTTSSNKVQLEGMLTENEQNP